MTPTPRDLGAGYAAATATLLSWVAVALFLEHFTTAIDVWTANGWRYGFALVLWSPVAAIIIRRRGVRGIPWASVAVPAALWFAGQVQFAASFYYVGPGMVTFIVRVQILGVIVISAMLVPAARRLLRHPGVWLGVGLVLGGAGGMLAFGAEPPKVDDWTGVLLSAGAGITFAAYGVALRFLAPPEDAANVRADRPPRLEPLERFAFIAPMVGIASVVTMLVFGEEQGRVAASLDFGQLALLALSSILGVMVGHLAFFMAIDRIGVVAASSIVQAQPFLVALVAWFLFDELLTWPQVAAGTVLVAGATILARIQTGRT